MQGVHINWQAKSSGHNFNSEGSNEIHSLVKVVLPGYPNLKLNLQSMFLVLKNANNQIAIEILKNENNQISTFLVIKNEVKRKGKNNVSR